MSEEEKKKEQPAEEEDEVVMMACCPEGEGGESIKERVLMRIGGKLGERSNVVMTRLSDEDLKQIDALVEVEAFKSRSEAAAFFIKEGIQARKDLFENVMPTVEKIRALKEQAKQSLNRE